MGHYDPSDINNGDYRYIPEYDWQEDLFGGRAKEYPQKGQGRVPKDERKHDRMYQNKQMREENERRGGTNDYPHASRHGENNSWFFSNSPKSKREKLN